MRTTSPKKRELSEMELTKLLAKEVGTVDLDKVLSYKALPNGSFVVLIGGKRLTQTEVENLQKEAKMFKQLRLYDLITNTLKHQSELFMFEKAKDFEGMRGGKFLLHAISIFRYLVDACEKPLIPKTGFDRTAHPKENIIK